MRGIDEATRDELASVPPSRVVAIAGFRAFDRALEVGTRITAVAGKDTADVFGLVGEPWQTVDVFTAWQLGDTRADLMLGNVFDVNSGQSQRQPEPGFDARGSRWWPGMVGEAAP